MNPKTTSEKNWIFGVIAVLMALTRFHHEGTAVSLPDASIAVFFIGGLYLKSLRGFMALLTLAFAIDYLAITGFDVSDYCVSPAYVFLIPTYGAMWYGGLWLSRRYHSSWGFFGAMFVLSMVLSASVAFLVSNASFFFFSGKLGSVGILEYALALSTEYLPYLGATALYAAMGIGVELLLNALVGLRPSWLHNR